MVKPSSVFILLRLDGVDYQVTGYSYDMLSPDYMASPLPLPLVQMFAMPATPSGTKTLYSH
jgi:hypothetical protein